MIQHSSLSRNGTDHLTDARLPATGCGDPADSYGQARGGHPLVCPERTRSGHAPTDIGRSCSEADGGVDAACPRLAAPRYGETADERAFPTSASATAGCVKTLERDNRDDYVAPNGGG